MSAVTQSQVQGSTLGYAQITANFSTASTTTFNGQVGGRFFGGITISNIKITEYAV